MVQQQKWRHGFLFLSLFLTTTFYPFPEAVARSTDAGHWEVILIYGIIGFLLLHLYLKGLQNLPGQDLADILARIGKWPMRLLLVPFVVYLERSLTTLLRGQSEMMSIILYKQTPLWVLYTVFLALACYLAVKGFEVIVRVAVILLVVFGPILLFVLGATVKQVDLHFFFPAFDWKFQFFTRQEFYLGFFGITPFLYLGMGNFVQGGIAPKGHLYYRLYGLLVMLLLMAAYIPMLVYGSEAVRLLEFAFLLSMDSVDLEWFVFDRVTIFFLLAVSAFLILYLGMWLWMIVRLLRRAYLPLKSWMIEGGVAVLSFIICLMMKSWDKLLSSAWVDTPLRAYVIVVIPVLVYFIGRKKGGATDAEDQAAA